jgi:hypothetical protein
MKLKLKNTPEQIELVKAIGSNDFTVSREAQEAFAAFVGPVVQEVLQQAGSAAKIYTDSVYDADDNPSYPLDLYYQETDTDYFSVWSQTMAGGLPASQDISALQELKIATYRLDSAMSYNKKYARRARLDVVSKVVERLAQEILIKQERNAWAVIMKALAEAQTTVKYKLGIGLGATSATSNEDNNRHVIRCGDQSTFKLNDLSSLINRIKRINSSWAGGTAANVYSNGITDLFVSPEIEAEIRAFSFTPARSDDAVTTKNSQELSDNMREQIYKGAGMSEIFGVTINTLNELGTSQKYNALFDTFAGSTSYTDIDASNGTAFAASTDEVLVGVDLSREAFIRPVAQQAESGGTFTTLPDDQFLARHEKVGFYGFLEEGRVCLDARAVAGVIVG